MSILIKKVRVIDPSLRFDKICDIYIEDNIIAQVSNNIKKDADIVIDGNGKIAAPGFVDMHVHFRDPGFLYKEDIYTGAKSAINGGFCSVACMPNTNPCIDSKEVLEYVLNKSKDTGINVFPVAAMTRGLLGRELCDYAELKKAGAIAVSDDGRPVEVAGTMKEILEKAQETDILCISHCENLSLVKNGVINEGEVSKELNLPGISNLSETLAVVREVLLSSVTKSRLHIAHVSTKESVQFIRWAKTINENITCETAPHYISLCDEAVKQYGVNAKMNPPLRSKEDVEELINGIADGTIDAIATDHAPHSVEDKGTLLNGANGIVGLETSFAVCYTHLVDKGRISLRKLIRLMSTNPANILRINRGSLKEGSVADITMFDLGEYVVDKEKFSSKSRNTPFDKAKLKGRILYTIANGRILLDNTKI